MQFQNTAEEITRITTTTYQTTSGSNGNRNINIEEALSCIQTKKN